MRKIPCGLFGGLFLLGVLFGLSSLALAEGEPDVSLGSERRNIYTWQSDRCEDGFIPDAPARAFRRADGQIVLLATSGENWSLVGADFSSLKVQCQSLLRSSSAPQGEGGTLWIEAVYTHDGHNVAALVSQSLRREVRASGCVQGDRRSRCWLNRILAGASIDGGRSFSLVDPSHRVVASLGASYPPEAKSRFGVFTASNIVRRDNAYFIIAYAEGEGVQPAGNCIFRSPDPFRPELWRGWDGHTFTVDMTGEGRAFCKPLARNALPGEVRSLSYDTRRNLWVAVFQARLTLPGDIDAVPGFYLAVSPDLLAWQRPQRIMTAPTRAREDSSNALLRYPSLLDPRSASRNFDTLDHDDIVLFYTRQHLRNGSGTLNRDLQSIPVRLGNFFQ